MSNEKIKRGPVVAVADRKYSKPIPDEFLPLFERAGLIVDDNDHAVIFYDGGQKCGSVWGPSAGGEWFAYRGDKGAVTVASRDDGLRHVIGGALAEAEVPSFDPPGQVDVFAEVSYPDEVFR